MTEHLDMRLISELRELMEDDFGELIDTYLHDSELRRQQIVDAVASTEVTAIRNAAHSLKGSSSNIGAVQLAHLCQSLEDMGRAGNVANTSTALAAIEKELLAVQQLLRDMSA